MQNEYRQNLDKKYRLDRPNIYRYANPEHS